MRSGEPLAGVSPLGSGVLPKPVVSWPHPTPAFLPTSASCLPLVSVSALTWSSISTHQGPRPLPEATEAAV